MPSVEDDTDSDDSEESDSDEDETDAIISAMDPTLPAENPVLMLAGSEVQGARTEEDEIMAAVEACEAENDEHNVMDSAVDVPVQGSGDKENGEDAGEEDDGQEGDDGNAMDYQAGADCDDSRDAGESHDEEEEEEVCEPDTGDAVCMGDESTVEGGDCEVAARGSDQAEDGDQAHRDDKQEAVDSAVFDESLLPDTDDINFPDEDDDDAEDVKADEEKQEATPKPKDAHKPRKPLSPCLQHAQTERSKLVESDPNLQNEPALEKLVADAWRAVPDCEKEQLQSAYERQCASQVEDHKKTEAYKTFLKELLAWRDHKDLQQLKMREKANLPNKPRSGFQMFAVTLRELHGDLTDDIVSERWVALPAETQVQYHEESKAAWDRWEAMHPLSSVQFLNEREALEVKQARRRIQGEFREKFPHQGHTFLADFVVFLESREGQRYQKKMTDATLHAKLLAARRRCAALEPQKPKDAKELFTAVKRRELEGSRGDLIGPSLKSHISDLWDALPETDRAQFLQESAKLKENHTEELLAFQNHEACIAQEQAEQTYNTFRKECARKAAPKPKPKPKSKPLAKKMAVERPETMPVKPPNAFSLWSTEQNAAKKPASMKVWSACSTAEKQPFETEAHRLAEAHKTELASWYTTKDGKKHKRQLDAVAHKQRVEKAKQLLTEEPKKVVSAMMLFSTGNKGGGKVHERWAALSDEEKQKWEQLRVTKVKEYDVQMEAFRKTEAFKKFEKIAKTRSSPKGKAKSKTKSAKCPSMPSKAPSAFQFFVKSMSGSRKGGFAVLGKQWSEMGSAGQKQFVEMAAAAAKEHEAQREAWNVTPEGKKHARDMERKKRQDMMKKGEAAARKKYLETFDAPPEPEKPPGAQALFCEERRKALAIEQPSLSPNQVSVKLNKDWKGLSVDEKRTFEEKANALVEIYKFEIEEYKRCDHYKKYKRAVAALGTACGEPQKRKKTGDISDESDIMGSDSDSDLSGSSSS